METKYILILAVMGIAVLAVLFLTVFKRRPPEKVVRFADLIQLRWGGLFWEGRTVLPAWTGFQKRLGAYAGLSSDKFSTGEVLLSVASTGKDGSTRPTAAQFRTFRYLKDYDQAVRERILKAVFEKYPEWRGSYEEMLGKEFNMRMPELQSPADLKPLIGLSTVHILNVEKDGSAYFGFEFGCDWDEEHGLGVLCHIDRIVAVGQAEESFSESEAEADKAKR